MVEYRKEHQRVWGGLVEHRLRRTDAGLRIAAQRVDLATPRASWRHRVLVLKIVILLGVAATSAWAQTRARCASPTFARLERDGNHPAGEAPGEARLEGRVVGDRSYPCLVNAFAAGHADVIDMSTVLAGRMFEQGQKVQIFGVTTGPTTYILVPTDSSIRDVPDLKGKKLGAIPVAQPSRR